MTARPVVVVPSGGLPVTEAVSGYGTPVSVVTQFGLAVTVAPNGLPVVGLDTGSNVGPNYRMRALPGSFVINGQSANLVYHQITQYVMQAGAGAFAFAGEGMTPITGYTMQAGAGAFALTGQSADLKYVGNDAAETTAFLARANAILPVIEPELSAYKALINGLVTDGVLAQMDVLYIFATDYVQHAALNLAQNAYTGTLFDNGGSATLNFTQHRGLQSSDGAIVISNFNPTTASSPKYTRDSAHYAYWSNTAGAESRTCLGNDPASTHLHPSFGGDCYMRINDATSSGVAFSGAGGDGLYIASRTSASNRDCYYKGVAQGNANSAASTPPTNENLWILGVPGAPQSTKQCSAASFGGKLTPTQAASLYTRLRTYMTAVGVP